MEAFSLLTFECAAPSLAESDGPFARIHVVGDHPALGCWDVGKSVPLQMSMAKGVSGTACTVLPVSVPAGVNIEYKYVIFDGADLLRWEAFAGNRRVMPTQAELLVHDELDRHAPPLVQTPRHEAKSGAVRLR